MSGGSLNYVSYRVEEAAQEVMRQCDSALHRAFANHLMKVAKALHEVEWVMSGDTLEGSDIEAIEAVITKQHVLTQAIADAEAAYSRLSTALAEARGG